MTQGTVEPTTRSKFVDALGGRLTVTLSPDWENGLTLFSFNAAKYGGGKIEFMLDKDEIAQLVECLKDMVDPCTCGALGGIWLKS